MMTKHEAETLVAFVQDDVKTLDAAYRGEEDQDEGTEALARLAALAENDEVEVKISSHVLASIFARLFALEQGEEEALDHRQRVKSSRGAALEQEPWAGPPVNDDPPFENVRVYTR